MNKKNGTEIKIDRRNYRSHDERNKALIEKSLKELGMGRSILMDSGNEIIAGNGVYEQAQKLGIKTKIIETAGDELIIVKRTDLKYSDPKRKQLAIMDNSTSDSSSFAEEILIEDFSVEELIDMGHNMPDLSPSTIDQQGQLDEKKKIICPNCQHEFTN